MHGLCGGLWVEWIDRLWTRLEDPRIEKRRHHSKPDDSCVKWLLVFKSISHSNIQCSSNWWGFKVRLLGGDSALVMTDMVFLFLSLDLLFKSIDKRQCATQCISRPWKYKYCNIWTICHGSLGCVLFPLFISILEWECLCPCLAVLLDNLHRCYLLSTEALYLPFCCWSINSWVLILHPLSVGSSANYKGGSMGVSHSLLFYYRAQG